MSLPDLLATLGGMVVVLGVATRVPPALAAFVHSLIPVVAALRDLRLAFKKFNESQVVKDSDPENLPNEADAPMSSGISRDRQLAISEVRGSDSVSTGGEVESGEHMHHASASPTGTHNRLSDVTS
jgi:hypothetical protein